MDFEDIRSYTDAEVSDAIQIILESGKVNNFLADYISPDYTETILSELSKIRTIDEFQLRIISRIISALLQKSGAELFNKGLENLDTSAHYLFVSNHRDIILDPVFLNYLLLNNGFRTSEIAIGNNLLIEPWIEALVRINKSFIVKRDLAGRDLFFASHTLSSYIRHTLTARNSNVWIAQREGRAKDGNDTTQTSLLKMLLMSADKIPPSDGFRELHIIPVAITYEFDPCDVLKAKELYLNSIGIEYIKTPEDDLMSMSLGLLEMHGRICYMFSREMRMNSISKITDINKASDTLANEIDLKIYSGYEIFPSHYYCFDRFHGIARFKDRYSDEYVEIFENIISKKISKYLPEFTGNPDFLHHVYRQYSNILKNAFSVNPKIIQ